MPFDPPVTQRLEQALASVRAQRWHRATFVSDEHGTLHFHTGQSVALRATSAQSAGGESDSDESLYITSLSNGLLLGVLFVDGVDIEEVRRYVTPLLSQITTAIER